jgi:beta-lactamase regulating signal transducer with metallopeptidase domain
MSLPYLLRLTCLLAVVLGVFQLLLQLILALTARPILRLMRAANERQRERTLYLLQVGPLLMAFLFAGAVCLPQYVRHEPGVGAERVGWISMLLASGVLLWFGTAAVRGLRLTARTMRFVRASKLAGHDSGIRRAGIPVISLPNDCHVVALAGFLKPVILVPRNLLESGGLGEEALALALDHERSHADCMDNWKLLSLSFLPRLPFGFPGSTWFEHWQRAAECAADDDAVRGDRARCLLLADTLLKIARVTPPPQSRVIYTALISRNEELAARIDRLIQNPLVSQSQRSMLPQCVTVTVAVIGTAVAISPWVYGISELILHLG